MCFEQVLLSATTFSERELMRSVAASGVLVSEMSAEYCTGSKAYIEVVPYLSSLLDHQVSFTVSSSIACFLTGLC